MKKYIINGKVIFTTTNHSEPHGRLRDILIDAMLRGDTVEIEEE